MKSGGRTLTASRARFELRQVLVVSQVALSLVLLVAALLFSGSLRNLLAVDAGFRQTGILIANVDFSRLKIPSARRIAFKHNLFEKLRALPGIASAGEVAMLPLSGGSLSNAVWKASASPDTKVESKFNWFSEGYLQAMGIPLLAGRDFNARDALSASKVAIVNQAFTHLLGLGPNPVGAKFRREATPSSPEEIFEIVGLVRDTKYFSLREQFLPIAFIACEQDPGPDPFTQIVIRSTLPLTATTSAVRGALKQVSPMLNIDFRSFETQVREGLTRERLMALLSGFFGGLAALISAVGLYGVMSYLVVRRTNEIGVRMALGARRGNIITLILRQACGLLGVGVAAGILLTLPIAGTARSMLFGLKPFNLPTLTLAAAFLTAVTVVASYIPARRAARMQPVMALREE